MLSLAEELLLLALDDEKGTFTSGSKSLLDFGLAGALLMELTLMHKLDIEENNLVVVNATPTGLQMLDEVLVQMLQSRKNRSPQYWVNRLSYSIKNLINRLLNQLVEKKILKIEKYQILWVIPSSRYPTLNIVPEWDAKERIRQVVLESEIPDVRTAALISLVKACRLVDEIFTKEERGLAKKRIKEITESNLIAKGISDVAAEVEAGVIAAVTASIVTSTVASSTSQCN